MATVIGVDVGGTKIAAGAVVDGVIARRVRIDSPAHDSDGIVAAIVEAVGAISADGPPDAVGVGAAGLVDLSGQVRYSPNLAWVEMPLRERLRTALGLPVVVENDANAAAWAEFCYGAARRASRSAVMLTVGTGVGGGLVLDGRLVRGAHGLGAEFGHMIVAEGGRRCPCGNTGCLEAYASGSAIGHSATARRRDGGIAAGSPLDREVITGQEVTAAARGGDRVATAVLAEAGHWLGVGLASIANALDPEVFVIGGGGVDAGDLLLEPARAALEPRLMGHGHRAPPAVVPALLGPDAGIIGAALLATGSGGPA